jgi:acetyltransferase-like isoleucine patch superfamily enzyme
MTPQRHRLRAGRVLDAATPTGLRRLVERRRLRARFGLASVAWEGELHVGPGCSFGAHCRLTGPTYVSESSIGDYSYVEMGCRISQADIGRFCAIAPYTLVGLAEHPTRDYVALHPAFYRHVPDFGWDLVDTDARAELTRTRIGNDVWLGAGVCVRSGVTIGDGAVIGAGAVVISDVPPYAVYAGVPARLVRHRFDEATVARLLEIRWWDRDTEWLRAHADEMRHVDSFVRRHATGRQTAQR